MKRNIKTYTQYLNEDLIPGGIADLRKPGEFNQADLDDGIKIEMEHTSDENIAREIAMDHLTEDPSYYKKLATIEVHEGVKYGVQHEGEMWNVYTKHPKTGAPMLYKVCADRKEARLVFNNYKASLKK
jgi:hypothetical protein